MRLKSSKKTGAVTRPSNRKQVCSERPPSVANRIPPSKASTTLLIAFSFLFDFCCCWPARKAGISNSKETKVADKSFGKKRPIPSFQESSVCFHGPGLQKK